ncbi:MAG TPA: flagellar hook capping FlgD N-terminal domain-containing protein [Actinomycetota bacterium]|nr:flagellar hook capping FlgD N-terminal domain-containing protein [Actinomycetota bacterium]
MVDPISSSGLGLLGAPPPDPSTATGLGALDGQAFLRLMVAQLKYQNPFDPMDTSDMLQQTAALTTVETLQRLASTERLLMGLVEASVATSLIGRHVSALDASGEEVTGVVTEVGFTADGAVVRIGDEEVPVKNLVGVKGSGPEGTAVLASQG